MREEPGVLVLTQNGRASAVVQDYAQYQLQQEGLLMLKLLVQGEADIAQAQSSSHGGYTNPGIRGVSTRKPQRRVSASKTVIL